MTRTDVQVRGFRPDEWELLRELRLRALSQDPDAFFSTREREVAFTDEIWRERTSNAGLATCDGEGAGIVSAVPVDGDGAELVAMWVARDFRGRGVGGALVAWVVAEARRAGRAFVRLAYAHGNDDAARLYARCGFVETDDDEHAGARRDEIDHVMLLTITPVSERRR